MWGGIFFCTEMSVLTENETDLLPSCAEGPRCCWLQPRDHRAPPRLYPTLPLCIKPKPRHPISLCDFSFANFFYTYLGGSWGGGGGGGAEKTGLKTHLHPASRATQGGKTSPKKPLKSLAKEMWSAGPPASAPTGLHPLHPQISKARPAVGKRSLSGRPPPRIPLHPRGFPSADLPLFLRIPSVPADPPPPLRIPLHPAKRLLSAGCMRWGFTSPFFFFPLPGGSRRHPTSGWWGRIIRVFK